MNKYWSFLNKMRIIRCSVFASRSLFFRIRCSLFPSFLIQICWRFFFFIPPQYTFAYAYEFRIWCTTHDIIFYMHCGLFLWFTIHPTDLCCSNSKSCISNICFKSAKSYWIRSLRSVYLHNSKMRMALTKPGIE